MTKNATRNLSNADTLNQAMQAIAQLHAHIAATDDVVTALRLEIEGAPELQHIVDRLEEIEGRLAESPAHGELRAQECIIELGARLMAALIRHNAQVEALAAA